MEENRAVVLHRPGMTAEQAYQALYNGQDCEVLADGVWRLAYLKEVTLYYDTECRHTVTVICADSGRSVTVTGADEIAARLRLVVEGSVTVLPMLLEERVSDG